MVCAISTIAIDNHRIRLLGTIPSMINILVQTVSISASQAVIESNSIVAFSSAFVMKLFQISCVFLLSKTRTHFVNVVHVWKNAIGITFITDSFSSPFYMRNIALILSKIFKDIIHYFQCESRFSKVA